MEVTSDPNKGPFSGGARGVTLWIQSNRKSRK